MSVARVTRPTRWKDVPALQRDTERGSFYECHGTLPNRTRRVICIPSGHTRLL